MKGEKILFIFFLNYRETLSLGVDYDQTQINQSRLSLVQNTMDCKTYLHENNIFI